MPTYTWFPTTIYGEELNPSAKVKQDMVSYVDDFRDKNLAKFSYNPTLTGDSAGDYRLYKKDIFSWLNKEVSFHCKKYLSDIGIETDKIKLHATRAWPVVIRKGGYISRHNHPNAVLSVVYYLQSDGTGGNIKFHATNSPMIHFPCLVGNPTPLSGTNCYYGPDVNRILIFPSSLEHEVEIYSGESDRYSISYDIIVTRKSTSSHEGIEYTISDPSEWKDLR